MRPPQIADIAEPTRPGHWRKSEPRFRFRENSILGIQKLFLPRGNPMSREAIAAVILFPRDFVLTGRALDGWIDRCGKRAPTDRILKMVATLVFLSLYGP